MECLLAFVSPIYVHIPTTSIKAEQLFNIMREAIERLEQMGLKVIVVCADGASSN